MNNADDPTIGRLVADASRDLSALVQSEIRLAKSELKFSVKAGGIGAGLLAVAAFFGLLIVIMERHEVLESAGHLAVIPLDQVR